MARRHNVFGLASIFNAILGFIADNSIYLPGSSGIKHSAASRPSARIKHFPYQKISKGNCLHPLYASEFIAACRDGGANPG